jgi:hypothetical protein
MSDAPAWKKLFDRLDAGMGTRINDFVRSEDFATLLALAQRGQREFGVRSERVTRRVLHSLNLPAGSDVNRLLVQIGNLEREVRELRKRLVDAERTTKPAVRATPRTRAVSAAPARPKGVTRSGTTPRTGRSPRAAAS